METTTKFSVSLVGESTGKPYSGDFVVKTVLTRRDAFIADERRRLVIGSNAESVPPGLNSEAFVLGQLMVRIVESPTWWRDSDGGLNMEDLNVTMELFKLAMEKEEERITALKKDSEKAVKELTKK